MSEDLSCKTKFSRDKLTKLKLSKKWKGVMACDVSPVAMFHWEALKERKRDLRLNRWMMGYNFERQHWSHQVRWLRYTSCTGGHLVFRSCSNCICPTPGRSDLQKFRKQWRRMIFLLLLLSIIDSHASCDFHCEGWSLGSGSAPGSGSRKFGDINVSRVAAVWCSKLSRVESKLWQNYKQTNFLVFILQQCTPKQVMSSSFRMVSTHF